MEALHAKKKKLDFTKTGSRLVKGVLLRVICMGDAISGNKKITLG